MDEFDNMITKDESKKLSNFLKWVGIAALAAVPVILLVKKMKAKQDAVHDESDIFDEELSS